MTARERRELIKSIQAAVQQRPAADDHPWVLETPDNGLTVTKRKFGEREKFYLSNVNGKWYNYEDALQAVRQQDREADLRAEHPSLADAYRVYQEILAMVDPGSPDQENN